MSHAPYEPPIPFARIAELITALDGEAELSKVERLEIAIVLSDLGLTFNKRKRRRGAPVSKTRMLAQLAIQVARRFDVKDAAAVSAAAPLATQADQETIERTMRKIRSGEIEKPTFFFDEAVNRAGARLGPLGKSGKK